MIGLADVRFTRLNRRDELGVSRRSRLYFEGGQPACSRGSRTVPGSGCPPLVQLKSPTRRAFRPRGVRIDDGGHRPPRLDAPIPRPIAMPSDGLVVAIPQVGGLHHRYERQAA
jgi:hypothetical protein